MTEKCSVDVVGNELIEGRWKRHKHGDGRYSFRLKQVEAYQITWMELG